MCCMFWNNKLIKAFSVFSQKKPLTCIYLKQVEIQRLLLISGRYYPEYFSNQCLLLRISKRNRLTWLGFWSLRSDLIVVYSYLKGHCKDKSHTPLNCGRQCKRRCKTRTLQLRWSLVGCWGELVPQEGGAALGGILGDGS